MNVRHCVYPAILFGCFLAARSPALAASEQPVRIDVAGGHLNGSLVVPEGNGPFAVAVIVAGSGPTDRDGDSVFVHGDTYKKLANALAAAGIATLRYDKRGVAASVSVKAPRFDDYVNDACAVASFLEHDARFSHVSIVGHSEGSLIAILAAQRDPNIRSIVLLEGAGRKLTDVLDEQMQAQPGISPETLAKVKAIDASLKAGKTVANVDPAFASLFSPSLQPFIISEDAYDPSAELAKVRSSVLIVHGSTDLQTTLTDERLLAAADPKASVALIDGMNHALVDAPLDRKANLAAYDQPSLALDSKLVTSVTQFLQSTSGAASASPGSSPPASVVASAASTAAPVPSDAITARAKEWVHRLQSDTIDRSQLDTRVNTGMTDRLAAAASAQLAPLGDPTAFTYVDTQNVQTSTSYIYKVSFGTTALYFIFSLDADQKIGGLVFRRA